MMQCNSGAAFLEALERRYGDCHMSPVQDQLRLLLCKPASDPTHSCTTDELENDDPFVTAGVLQLIARLDNRSARRRSRREDRYRKKGRWYSHQPKQLAS